MKILHTADWHIGKSLYKHDLYEDIKLFFSELMLIISDENIDVLLISGDIFDLANPSNTDKEIYYQFLTTLMKENIQVVITAGNHDSVRMLEAPKSLLKHLNIHIVGDGRSSDITIPISDPITGSTALIILAVPYLRDRDVRLVQAGESYEQKKLALREAIVAYYKEKQAFAQKLNSEVPIIAMGHLYMQGASTSDSERDIQMGNEAGIPVEDFGDLFTYMALGHIHRPQKINKAGNIRYSGSPIALSFSERKDEKQIIILELQGKSLNIVSRKLTTYRKLVRLTGTVAEIRASLLSFENDSLLKAYIELQAKEIRRDPSKILELIELSQMDSTKFKIVNNKITFEEGLLGLAQKKTAATIEDLQPIEVFRTKIDEQILDIELKKGLESAFHELLEEWESKD